ncbi:MAG TPA: translation initiation factor IF-2 subunit alpha [Methanoregulaceae archaeon]|nr:translation initiation factor IF-2 subunit alpha [Methanoregulaceae archaeon]HPD74535.1 translation initiation factor IF-2 subunit alpha [Methanoregulaceae archaeon]HRY76128.1 translation initiation factor IF-2 subunit alpha [Methanoregulaceae archaeon]
MQDQNWPEEGELVVCTVENVKDFVAFVSLDEYGGRQGLIPISEIATGWIKYIRDHIREGQKIVCKVLNVDKSRGHIDLSLKDVNEHQRREKIREWKNESKAKKWIGFVAKASGEPAAAIEEAIIKKYGVLYPVFEDLAIDGDAVVKKLGLSKKTSEALLRVASENVKVPRVEVIGNLILTSTLPDGVSVIKKALKSAEVKIAGVDIELLYLGAPTYRIKVTAPDYKKAEKTLEKAANAAISVVEKSGGEGKLIKKPKSGKAQ